MENGASNRRPEKVLKCPQLVERVKTRADLLQRVEGTAQVKDASGRWQLFLALRADRQFWIEIRSPFGAPFAVLRSDGVWAEFLVPRRRELYRIPAAEFWQPSRRQKAFLEILPMKIVPNLMFEIFFGRVDPKQMGACRWLPDENQYSAELDGDYPATIRLDGRAFFPTSFVSRTSSLSVRQIAGDVKIFGEVEFGGSFEAQDNGRKLMTFTWTTLNWLPELGESPPVFPNTKKMKILEY